MPGLVELEGGMAVVMNGEGHVVRQLVKYRKNERGETRFESPVAEAYATKKQAEKVAGFMHWPKRLIRKGWTRLHGEFYFLTYDGVYALACWDMSATQLAD